MTKKKATKSRRKPATSQVEQMRNEELRRTQEVQQAKKEAGFRAGMWPIGAESVALSRETVQANNQSMAYNLQIIADGLRTNAEAFRLLAATSLDAGIRVSR